MSEGSDQPNPLSTVLRSFIAIAWVGCFVFAFLNFGPSFEFPNDDEPIELSRADLLKSQPGFEGRPIVLLATMLFDNLLGGTDPKTEGWRFLQWELVLYAAGLIIGMIALGRLLLRLLRVRRNPVLEASVFAYGLGVSATTLLVLGCGLAGMLESRIFIGVLACATFGEVACCAMFREKQADADGFEPTSSGIVWFCLILVAPMLLMILLGALSPPVDFDVREYHLQGPKEHFQNGQITFLRHNAYTSFPFLTEMLSLLGMAVMGDWYTGALLGKLLLASFAPMTALALIAAGRRCFDSRAGWLAAAVFLTTPWIYRISIIAYAEGGLTFFLFASVLVGARFAQERSYSNLLLAGLMCGSAMACKYPALLSVVAPVGVALVCVLRGRTDETRGELLRPLAVFGVGIVIAVGPWLLKNLIETGNPVYPLAYSVFGGEDWTPEINERWRAGHSPPNHKISDLANRVVEVTIGSDWLSPLLFAFAPLAFFATKEWRRSVIGFWLFILWMFASWWVFTHRIDRFWVPMIPVVAMLAGVGVSSIRLSIVRLLLLAVLSCGAVFTITFSGSAWSGYNAWFTDPAVARTQIEDQFAGMLRRAEDYNKRDSGPGRVLCVGEAAVFEAQTQVIYNTVFDLNIFQELCGDAVSGGPDSDVKLRPIDEIKSRLADRNVSYIVVNWMEVLRYRRPGSYGFSEFVQPVTFQKLVGAGVLTRLDVVSQNFETMSKHDQEQVNAWGAVDENGLFISQEIYRVTD